MKKISMVLKSVFDALTKDSERFIDWYGFRTAEILIGGTEIGIGIDGDFSAIKLFTIKTVGFEKDDYRKFSPTFRIGKPNSGIECWIIGIAETNLHSYPENFSQIAQHFSVVNEIVKMIEEASRELIKEKE